jgi:plastocyanin
MRRLLFVVALVFARCAHGQGAGIVGLQDGRLTWTNADPALEYRVEWASSATNAYSNRYESIAFIKATGTTMTTEVPVFLRIAGNTALSQNVFRASDLPLTIPATNGNTFSVQWSDNPNGPWSTNWVPQTFAGTTGVFMTVQTPRFFRVDFFTLVSCASNFAGCSTWTDATAPGAGRTISFGSFFYSPACLKIAAGQTVTFSGSFGSHPLSPQCQAMSVMGNVNSGTVLQYTFTAPGFYNYQCGFHGGLGMQGNIWVVP